MFSVATTVLETGAYYQAVFKSNDSGMLKCFLASNTKPPLRCVKNMLLKCPGLGFWEESIEKSHLECVKCEQVPSAFKLALSLTG